MNYLCAGDGFTENSIFEICIEPKIENTNFLFKYKGIERDSRFDHRTMPNHTNLTVITKNLQFDHLFKHIHLSLHMIDIQVSAAAGMISSRAANTNLFKFFINK